MGINPAIDDFSAGYSRLNYIDHSFIANITADPEDAAIATW